MENITVIDFSKQISDILNFDRLPSKVQKVIKMAERIESRGFQELNGYEGRGLIFSAGGYWKYHDEAMEYPMGFIIKSIGAKYNEELSCGNIALVELQWSDKN